MKKIAVIITLTLAVLLMPQSMLADTSASNEINWTSYTAAKTKNDENRKFFIYFRSDRCGFCNMLEKKTFTDKEVVAYINSNYTPIIVNAGKEPKLAAQFNIQGVPDLRFLTSKGENIARWPGFIETKRLLPLLQYINTDSYKNISYKEFLKQEKRKDK